jgi:hypothetical protein
MKKQFRLFYSVFFFAFCFGTQLSFASAQFQFNKGKPIVATLSDGREAQVWIDRKAPIKLTVPFTISANECSEAVNLTCQFNLTTGYDALVYRWSKNPDPSKIGQIVTFEPSGANSPTPLPLVSSNPYASSERRTTPIIARAIPNDTFTCEDYSWLPNSEGKLAPPSAFFQNFDVEGMFYNPETSFTEDRTEGMEEEATVEQNRNGAMEFTHVKRYTSGVLSTLRANIWSIIMKSPSGDYCTISMKPDTSAANGIYIEYVSRPPNFGLYLYGADEYSDPNNPPILFLILNTSGLYDFQ